MPRTRRPDEQAVRELTREVLALPEQDRTKLFERLREDLGEVAAPDRADAINARMAKALEIFQAVATHLALDDAGKKALAMREFNAAPSAIREGWSAKRVAAAYFDSWPLVKQMATGGQMPVSIDQRFRRRQLARRRRDFARHLSGLERWLATDPAELSAKCYDSWRAEANKRLGEGEKPFVAALTIQRTWKKKWPAIVADAQAGHLRLPPELEEEEPSDGDEKEEVQPPTAIATADPVDFVFDPDLIARRLRQIRTQRGWSQAKTAESAGLNPSHVSRIESGERRELAFAVLAKLAQALGTSIDTFVTDDEKTGLPPPSPRGGSKGRGRAAGRVSPTRDKRHDEALKKRGLSRASSQKQG